MGGLDDLHEELDEVGALGLLGVHDDAVVQLEVQQHVGGVLRGLEEGLLDVLVDDVELQFVLRGVPQTILVGSHDSCHLAARQVWAHEDIAQLRDGASCTQDRRT